MTPCSHEKLENRMPLYCTDKSCALRTRCNTPTRTRTLRRLGLLEALLGALGLALGALHLAREVVALALRLEGQLALLKLQFGSKTCIVLRLVEEGRSRLWGPRAV